MSDRAKRLLETMDRLRGERSNWLNQWQVIGEYVSQIKQDFQVQHEVGEFLNDEIFDSTGTFAARNSASALLGMLWPATAAKNIQIVAPDDLEDVTEEENDWYSQVATRRLAQEMDNTNSNLALSLDEYMIDQTIFGTSGVGVFWDDGLSFRPFSVKETIIDEGKNGRVNAAFISYEWTPRRVVETYGIENVSEKVRELFESGKEKDRVKIAVGYSPRNEAREEGEGNLNMPIESLHVEVESKHILKESGFSEFPIAIARFRKLSSEKYGRSPAMDAYPDIREINALREAIIVATEKQLDPPLGLLNSGILGNGVVDTSAGALNIFDASASIGNTPPIFPINTVGDMATALARIEDLKESIAQHFAIDRLLDFNNQTAMTATETNARAQIRSSSLTSLITRQIAELFTPVVQRAFNLMVRHDRFGFIEGTIEAQIAQELGEEEITFIPERIAKRLLEGKNAYEVRYTTPADRVTNAEELNGMIQTIQIVQGLMQTNPEAQAFIDVQEITNNLSRLTGSPPEILRSQEEVEEILAEQAEQAAQQQQLEQAAQVADIAQTAAGAQA